MGFFGVIGGAVAAMVGLVFGQHQQQQPPPPPKIHVKPAQQSTNNNTVSQTPNQQQTGTNTNTQNVGGISFNVYVGCNTQPQEPCNPESTPHVSVNNSPAQTQNNTVNQKSESVASQEKLHATEEKTPTQYITSSSYPHPAIAIGAITIFAGMYVFYELRSMEKYLYKDRKLFNWNRAIATNDLQAMDPQVIGPVLASFVQQRYSIERTVEHYSSPVVTFINKLSKEERILKKYVRAAKILKAVYINNILGLLDKHITYAEDSLARLNVMKQIIETWNASMRTGIAG